MAKKKKGVTRGRFLEQVGLAGGSVALYETMTALGLIHLPEAWAGPPEIPQGGGKSVVILGAGIAGLTAAYELTRANYNCKIIELTERPGGRNHTARRGTVLKEVNDVQTDGSEESKEFKKVVKELKNFAEKSDGLLETFIRSEESWFWNTVLKMMK